MKTLLKITASMVVIMLPIDTSVLAHTTQHHVYQNVTLAQQAAPLTSCKFNQASLEEKIILWLDMTPRHRDFHWRQMSPEERQDFKKLLPLAAKESLTHRYAPKHFFDGMNDVPRGWRKRLTKEERMILREQIVHAQKNLLSNNSGKSQTPAEAESERELQIRIRRLNDRMHAECIVFSFSQTTTASEAIKEQVIKNPVPDAQSATKEQKTEISSLDLSGKPPEQTPNQAIP